MLTQTLILAANRLYQATKRKASKFKDRTMGNKRKRKSTHSSEGEDNNSSSQDVLSPSEFAPLNGGSSLEALSLLPETKNLVDGLSRFFTPSNKRLSRVSLSAIQPPLIDLTSHEQSGEERNKCKPKEKLPRSVSLKSHPKTAQSKSQQAATKLIKRSKKVQATRGRKKSEGPPLSGQLRGLFDGLSEFFNATGERKRTLPVYNPYKQKKHSSQHFSSSANSYSFSSSNHCSLDSPRQHNCDIAGGSLNVCISDSCASSRRGGPELAVSSTRRELSWWDEMKHLMQMTLEEFRHFGAHPTDARNRWWAARGRRTWFSRGRGHSWGGSGRIFRGKLSSPLSIIPDSTPM